MIQDIFLVSTSITLIVLSVILIVLFAMLNKILMAFAQDLQSLQKDLSPLISDARAISLNLAVSSEILRNGTEQVSRVTAALGNIGDDLEDGRRAVKGTVEALGALTSPWLAILKLFRK